ncbi:MAG: Rv3235 family protein [Nocardioidaceae bacterium]
MTADTLEQHLAAPTDVLSLQLRRLHSDRPAIDAATAAAATAAAADEPRQLTILTARASGFVQAVVEVLAGDRPCTQLARWADPRVYSVLVRCVSGASTSRASARRRQRARVVSVRVTCPAPRVAEVSARVSDGQRSRALAARLEQLHGRWVCTALEIG